MGFPNNNLCLCFCVHSLDVVVGKHQITPVSGLRERNPVDLGHDRDMLLCYKNAECWIAGK